jgi:hypothetical protein
MMRAAPTTARLRVTASPGKTEGGGRLMVCLAADSASSDILHDLKIAAHPDCNCARDRSSRDNDIASQDCASTMNPSAPLLLVMPIKDACCDESQCDLL